MVGLQTGCCCLRVVGSEPVVIVAWQAKVTTMYKRPDPKHDTVADG